MFDFGLFNCRNVLIPMKKSYISPNLIIAPYRMSVILISGGRVSSNTDLHGGDEGNDASMAY